MILELEQHELESIRLAMAILKQELIKEGRAAGFPFDVPTPTADGIAKKVNEALVAIQKDIEFEKQYQL